MESILGQALSMTTRHRSVPGAWHRADCGSVRTADAAGNERRETGAGTSHRLRFPHLSCQQKSTVCKQRLELVICDAVGKGPWSWAGGDWGSRRWAAPLQLCLDVPLGVLLPQWLKMDCWVFGQCYSLPQPNSASPFWLLHWEQKFSDPALLGWAEAGPSLAREPGRLCGLWY